MWEFLFEVATGLLVGAAAAAVISTIVITINRVKEIAKQRGWSRIRNMGVYDSARNRVQGDIDACTNVKKFTLFDNPLTGEQHWEEGVCKDIPEGKTILV